MAKLKTSQDLKKETAALIKKARKQEKELLRQAAQAELKIYADLGELTIRFLNSEIDKNELLKFATTNNLINKKDELNGAI